MPISKKYNQIQTSHKIVKKQTVQNHCFDSTIFVSHDSRVRSLDVYQVGSHQTLASAQAWEFKGADFHYIVAVLDQDIVKGDKLFMVEGIKCRGKV
ncbi:heparinase II/III-like protein, partial [Streptococcus pyogenes]